MGQIGMYLVVVNVTHNSSAGGGFAAGTIPLTAFYLVFLLSGGHRDPTRREKFTRRRFGTGETVYGR